MAVYGSLKLVIQDGYDSVVQCKASYKGLIWQCMAV